MADPYASFSSPVANAAEADPYAQFSSPVDNAAPDRNVGKIALRRGAIGLLGAPSDLVNLAVGGAEYLGRRIAGQSNDAAVANKVWPLDRPPLGSAQLYDAFEQPNVPMHYPADMTEADKRMALAGELAGGAGVGAIARIGSLPGALTRAALSQAAKIGAQEAASAGGSFAAMSVAPDNPIAQIAAGAIGGALPSAAAFGPLGMARRGYQQAQEAFGPQARAALAKDAVGRVMGDVLSPEAKANLVQADALRKEIAGFDPSVAQSSGMPSLARQQEALEGRMAGPALDETVARRQASQNAIDQYGQQVAPKGPPIDAALSRARKTYQATLDDLKRRFGENEFAARKAADIAYVDRHAAGGTIRTAIEDQRRAARESLDELSQRLGLDQAASREPGTLFDRKAVSVPFAAQAEALAAKWSKPPSAFSNPRNYPTWLGDAFKTAMRENGGVLTFADAKALRERLTDDVLNAAVGDPSGKNKAILQQARKDINGAIDDAFMKANPALAEKYQTWRQAYKREVIDPFETPIIEKLRQKTDKGFYQTPDEQVAGEFWKPGASSAAKAFKQATGGSDQAMASLRGIALDDLRDKVVVDGKIDPVRLASWKNAHKANLSEFPNIAAEVNDLEKTAQSLQLRAQDLTKRREIIGRDVLFRKLESEAAGQTSPEAVIDSALRNPKLASRLAIRLKGDPAALEALQKAVWEKAVGGDIPAFVQAHEPALKWIMGPAHLKNLERIGIARQIDARVAMPKGQEMATPQPGLIGGLRDRFGVKIPQVASRMFAVSSGRTSERFVLIEAATRAIDRISGANADDVLRAALYDKDLAAKLARAATEKAPSIPLKARLVQLGLAAPGAAVRSLQVPLKAGARAGASTGQFDPERIKSNGQR